jgi:hypothetical protein
MIHLLDKLETTMIWKKIKIINLIIKYLLLKIILWNQKFIKSLIIKEFQLIANINKIISKIYNKNIINFNYKIISNHKMTIYQMNLIKKQKFN